MFGGFVKVDKNLIFGMKDSRAVGLFAFIDARARYHQGLDLQLPIGKVIGRLEVNEVWTTFRDMADNTGMSVATVRKKLNSLINSGFIKKVRVTAVGTVLRIVRKINAVVRKPRIPVDTGVAKTELHTKKEIKEKPMVPKIFLSEREQEALEQQRRDDLQLLEELGFV